MPHNELLMKLWNIGITGNWWLWIKEYLSGRIQRVRINACYSSSLPVISGVPQGSIFGPLLFLVYVNDLPSQVPHSDLYLFADDTKCLKPISTPQDSLQLQQDLNNLSTWSADWKLSFNQLKCILLSFQSKHHQSATTAPYHINGHIIKQCLQHKDLGIVMSYDLSWTNHISLITNGAYKKNLDYYTGHFAQLTVFLLRNLYTYPWSDLNLFIALKFGVHTKLKTSSF